MKVHSLRMTLLIAAIGAGAAWGKEAVVTVSPEDMQGWVIVTNKGAAAGLVNGGPAVYERDKAFTAEDGRDLGTGA